MNVSLVYGGDIPPLGYALESQHDMYAQEDGDAVVAVRHVGVDVFL